MDRVVKKVLLIGVNGGKIAHRQASYSKL